VPQKGVGGGEKGGHFGGLKDTNIVVMLWMITAINKGLKGIEVIF
jgi:hypothetical protein